MLQDVLADALSAIKNADRFGKTECVVRANKLVKETLRIMKEHSYIGDYEFVDDGKSGKFRVELKGKIIECNVIKPRFSIQLDEFEKYEKRFLPAKEFGILIMTTPEGIMDHLKAKESKNGGKLIAFCY